MPPKTRDKTKAFLIVLGIVALGLLIFIASPAYRGATYILGMPDPFWRFRCLPTLTESEVSSIKIEITPWMKTEEKVRVHSKERDAISRLMAVLAKSEETTDHKCGNIGTITIETSEGEFQELRILPGHNSGYYEYRYNHCINRVDRKSFYAAMKGFGIKKLPTLDNSDEMDEL